MQTLSEQCELEEVRADNLRFDTEASNPQLTVLKCDLYHPHYHFQSCAQYLYLAATLQQLGQMEEMKEAVQKAWFQDHSVDVETILTPPTPTLPRKGGGSIMYDKHPMLDAEFCSNVGLVQTDAGRLHDEAISFSLSCKGGRNYIKDAITSLNEAISLDPLHSNSFFMLGKYYYTTLNYAEAVEYFREAVRLSHIAHDSYHQSASNEHFLRGQLFLEAQETELAINDFTKALDLHRGNIVALKTRAEAYRLKGSIALAEADERALES